MISGPSPGSARARELSAWGEARQVFAAVFDAPPEQREELAVRLCDGRSEVAREVLSLLAAHREADVFLEAPAAQLLAGDELPLPEQIGPYRLIGELGRGGMGRVVLAERSDEVFHKRVAIKLLRTVPSARCQALFLRERQVLADLEHPNIARILDGGTLPDGRPFLVMEHVDGRPIDEYCDGRRLPVRERLQLFLKVCEAVQSAHRSLVVHGDIKPVNVLVTADGEPKLIDFGIAGSLSDPLPADGATPEYASPEQLRGERITAAADVHGLGALLLELLTARRPKEVPGRRGASGARLAPGARRPSAARASLDSGITVAPAVAAARATSVPALRRCLRGDLRHLLARALATDPEERYGSVQELAADVRRFLAGEVVSAAPRSLRDLVRSKIARHPLASALAAAAVTFACVAVLLAMTVRREAQQEAARTRAHFALGNEILNANRRDALLPVHDRSELKRSLRAQVRGAAESMARERGTARGAAAYAVACGAFSLGEHESAREHLELALGEGFAADEVRLLLARTVLVLYGEALEALEGEGSLTGREPQLAEIDERYRRPAARHLTADAGPAAGPEGRYHAALLAFHRGRSAEAAAAARAAFGDQSWMYEAKQLEAEAQLEMAREAREREDFAAARQLVEQAGVSYGEALEVGRSAVPLWVGECARRARLYDEDTSLGPSEVRQGLALYDWALEPCRTALAIDAEAYGAHLGAAQIHWRRADGLVRSKLDPSAETALAVRAAKRAAQLRPLDSGAHRLLGLALLVRVRWARIDGSRPEEFLDQGETALRRSVSLNDRSAPAATALGNLLYARSGLARDPSERYRVLDESITWYERAVSLAPHDPKHAGNLGSALAQRGALDLSTGASPLSSLAAARSAFDAALRLAPNDPVALGNRARSFQIEAAYLVDTGGDAAGALAAADAGFALLLQIRPEATIARESIAVNRRLRAVDALRRRADPTAAILQGVASLREERRLVQRSAYLWVREAELHLIAARWEVESSRSPEAALTRAFSALAQADSQALSSPHHDRSVWAEAHWRRGRWRHQQGRDSRPDIAAGLAAVERSEEAPTIELWRGALLGLRAEVEGDSDSAADAASALEGVTRDGQRVPEELQRYVDGVLASATQAATDEGHGRNR